MAKILRQRTQSQAQVRVAQLSQTNDMGRFWFGALAAFAAGVFYFWSYFYGFTPGSVLIEH